MAVALDTGALIAFDRGDRMVAALLEATRRRRGRVLTSSGCVAQVWRGESRQVLLSRLLAGLVEVGLDTGTSRATGELCGRSTTTDVVDAHMALLVRDGDTVVTSDVDDLAALLEARGVRAAIHRC